MTRFTFAKSKHPLVLILWGLLGAASVSAELVGWWPLAETSGTVAVDYSGNGHNGTVIALPEASDAPTWENDPVRGQVLALNNNGGVQISAKYPSIISEMSVSFWLKGSSLLNKGTPFSAFAGSNDLFNAAVPRHGRAVRLTTPGGYEHYLTESFTNVRDNWHHWSFVVNGETGAYAIYLDGVLEAEGSFEGDSFSFSAIDKIHLGSEEGARRFFDGRISDVRVYNHVLSYQEIQSLLSPGNAAPLVQTESYFVDVDSPLVIGSPGVLGNDLDGNGDSLTAHLGIDPQHGALKLAADGSFTYLPDPGYVGPDQFTYKAKDGSDFSDSVVVSLEVLEGFFSASELQKFQDDLGVVLTSEERATLAALVKPTTSPQWRIDAEKRIEQHRKAKLSLQVVSPEGLPVPGAEVSVTLRKKKFRFGGIMDLKRFAGAEPSGVSTDEYRSLFLKLYDSVGLNNGLKPKLRSGFEPFLPEFFSWAKTEKIDVRGHLLIWPGGTHMSEEVTTLVEAIEESTDPDENALLKPQLRQTVYDEISEWARLWPVTEWDVANEVLTNSRIQNILGQQEMLEWFQLARDNAVDPEADLLINDFQIISAPSTGFRYSSRSTDFKSEIGYLLNNKAPLTKIGFQSRFKFEHPDPALLYQRMEEFDDYGLPMVGTEFEVVDLPPFVPSEKVRAQMTEEIMMTYFSHPSMEGFYAWNFLDEANSASMVNTDGTMKLNGLVWYYLNRIRYHTEETVETDVLGRAKLNAYLGDYEVVVRVANQSFPTTLSVLEDGTQQIVIDYRSPQISQLKVSDAEDAHCRKDSPENNYGSHADLQLRSESSKLFARRVYMKFDVSETTGTIVDARLRLTANDLNGEVMAYAVDDSSWEERAITWNSAPPIGEMIGKATAVAGETFEIDVTGTNKKDGLVTFALGTTVNPMFKVYSSESNSPPELVLTLHTPLLPTAHADSYALTQDAPLHQSKVGVLANDNDPAKGEMSAKLARDASYGTLLLASDGSFSYNPAPGFWGWDSFSYSAVGEGGRSEPIEVTLLVQRGFTDSEPDGLDDAWEMAQVGSLDVMNGTTDTDHDGSPDLSEFLAGTDPEDAADTLRILSLSSTAKDVLQLDWSSKPGKRYRVWKNSDLASENWEVVVSTVSAEGTVTAVPLNEDADTMFYRIEVLSP